jgi:hypothetical protein
MKYLKRGTGKIFRICETCGITFLSWVYLQKEGRGRFCSRKCRRHSDKFKQLMSQKKTGIPIHSDAEKEIRRKRMLGNQFRKGFPSYCKGLKRPEQTGSKHFGWKGDDVSYSGLHKWVNKYLGRPDTCEHCGKSGLTGHKIGWANKSGKYLRDLNDWIRLCVPCHEIYDSKL